MVKTYKDGEDALLGICQTPPDLAVVDIKMPRLDGIELLEKIRKKSTLPVIFLTSKDEEIDQLLGLKMGADDYITKPFSQKLLLERVKTILRRSIGNKSNESNNKEVIKRGKLSLNMDRYECFWEDTPIRLTVPEFLY